MIQSNIKAVYHYNTEKFSFIGTMKKLKQAISISRSSADSTLLISQEKCQHVTNSMLMQNSIHNYSSSKSMYFNVTENYKNLRGDQLKADLKSPWINDHIMLT